MTWIGVDRHHATVIEPSDEEVRWIRANPSDQFIRKLLTVIGGWYFATWEYAAITRFILDHGLPVDQLVTHRFPLADAPEAFRMFNARETEKAIFVSN